MLMNIKYMFNKCQIYDFTNIEKCLAYKLIINEYHIYIPTIIH